MDKLKWKNYINNFLIFLNNNNKLYIFYLSKVSSNSNNKTKNLIKYVILGHIYLAHSLYHVI